MNTEPQRTCPSCGNEFSGAMEFCPVCMLRKGLAGAVESGESSASADKVEPTTSKRFEHYELMTGEDGKPVELGRGAMGVTYKAFDVDLHCPVTLKEDSEEYSQYACDKILTNIYINCSSLPFVQSLENGDLLFPSDQPT
jgi:hypothetical protein